MSTKKHSQQEVKTFLEQNGCELLSDYMGYAKPITIKCRCGHVHEISFRSFRKYKSCVKCNAKKRRHTLEYIVEIFNQYGYKVVDKKYEGNASKINCICPKGHNVSLTYNFFSQGGRCGICQRIERVKQQTYSYEQIKENIEKENFKLITKKENYVNTHQTLDIQCLTCNQIWRMRSSRLMHWRCNHSGKLNYMDGRGPNWRSDREQMRQEKRFRSRCRHLVMRTLNAIGKSKDDKTFAILGYNNIDLENYFKTFPEWENIKDKEWHIDHIYPIQSFLDYNIFDVKLINCLDNLQPLIAHDNLSKNAFYNKKEFEEWLSRKGIIWQENKETRFQK